MVSKFYANAMRVDFQGALVTTVRGVQVNFNLKTINALYGLPDVDNKVYKGRSRAGGN